MHQITLHIVNRLSRTTLNSLKLELKEATSQMEAINQTLCELTDPEDDEPERWIEDALNLVTECFNIIEKYLSERTDDPVSEGTISVSKSRGSSRSTSASTKSTRFRCREKHAQAKLFQYELEVAKRQMEQERRSRELQNKMEEELRRTRSQMEREAQELERLSEETMKARKIQGLEENVQRAILVAKILNEDQDTLILKIKLSTPG